MLPSLVSVFGGPTVLRASNLLVFQQAAHYQQGTTAGREHISSCSTPSWSSTASTMHSEGDCSPLEDNSDDNESLEEETEVYAFNGQTFIAIAIHLVALLDRSLEFLTSQYFFHPP